MGDERGIAVAIICVVGYLLLVSMLYAMWIDGMYGVKILDVSDQLRGSSINLIPQDITETNFTDAETNFTGYIDERSLKTAWNPPIGLILYQNGYFDMRNIIAESNGNRTVTYYINNSAHSSFDIRVRAGYVNSYYQQILLRFANDKIAIPNNMFDFWPVLQSLTVYEYEYPYAGITEKDDIKITTVFNEITNTLWVYVDDTYLFTHVCVDGSGTYAGVKNWGDVLTVKNVNAHIVASAGTALTAFDSFLGFGLYIIKFIGFMLQLAVYNIDETYLPWQLNLITIKLPCLAIFGVIVVIARG